MGCYYKILLIVAGISMYSVNSYGMEIMQHKKPMFPNVDMVVQDLTSIIKRHAEIKDAITESEIYLTNIVSANLTSLHYICEVQKKIKTSDSFSIWFQQWIERLSIVCLMYDELLRPIRKLLYPDIRAVLQPRSNWLRIIYSPILQKVSTLTMKYTGIPDDERKWILLYLANNKEWQVHSIEHKHKMTLQTPQYKIKCVQWFLPGYNVVIGYDGFRVTIWKLPKPKEHRTHLNPLIFHLSERIGHGYTQAGECDYTWISPSGIFYQKISQQHELFVVNIVETLKTNTWSQQKSISYEALPAECKARLFQYKQQEYALIPYAQETGIYVVINIGATDNAREIREALASKNALVLVKNKFPDNYEIFIDGMKSESALFQVSYTACKGFARIDHQQPRVIFWYFKDDGDLVYCDAETMIPFRVDHLLEKGTFGKLLQSSNGDITILHAAYTQCSIIPRNQTLNAQCRAVINTIDFSKSTLRLALLLYSIEPKVPDVEGLLYLLARYFKKSPEIRKKLMILAMLYIAPKTKPKKNLIALVKNKLLLH